MKHLRSILTSIIAIVMVFAMGGTAFADDGATGYSISLDPEDTHTYKVYQVLTGILEDPDSGTDTVLLNASWGDSVKESEKTGDVKEFIKSITDTDDQTVANLVYGKIDTKKDVCVISRDQPATGLVTGYYIMVDVTDLSADDYKLDTQARHVVKVVNNINGMRIKWGTTEDDKIIVSDTLGENNDTKDNNTVGGKYDNVSVGDTVNYQITAAIPDNANFYNYFYFIVNDTLDEGLTLNAESIVVKIGDKTLEAGKGKGYILKTGDSAIPYSFQVGLNDAKSYAGKDVIVTYSAVLNKDAKIGQTPNKNTSTVTFSNNPNDSYDGEHYPGFPNKDEDGAMGVTPETVTKTYTTGIEIQKVDENGKVLTGATFELSGTSIEKVLTVEEVFTEDTNGDYYKLKDGTYTKDAPTADGEYMVKADSGATAGYVIDANYTGEGVKVVGGITYRPYAPDTDNGKDIYTLVTGNAGLYESTETKYKKTIEKSLVDTVTDQKISKAVDKNGLVRFDGLGAGTYTIRETVTPKGYNTLKDVDVTISLAVDGEGKLVLNDEGNPNWLFTGTGAYDADEGIYKITIQNNKGTALPETGGIGTTIFYIVGGVMVAGAVVFLLTKRRMADNE